MGSTLSADYDHPWMRLVPGIVVLALLGAAIAVGLGPAAGAESDAAALRRCPSFESQADAQAYSEELGGTPRRTVGSLDADRDGVACEGLSGPFQGYATIAYNAKRDFFYGVATMPSLEPNGGGFACLEGNKFDPEGPRRVNIYAERSQGDIALVDGGKGAEAKPASGRLLWKVDRANLRPGRFYVKFEERVRVKPYGPNECPEFSSQAVRLP